MTWEVLHSECRAALATIADCSVDAVVTDPPYDLTQVSRRGSPRTNDPATPFGRHRLQSKGGGFMGLQWDATGIAFDPEFWREVLRVLKPGGHLLSMGGTRTFHWMACAIESAGFEIRDCIVWHHARGFPKSLDVSKAIDKAAGVQPVGEKPASLGMADNPQWNPCHRQLVMPEAQTEYAKRWKGWGTALKPASELICVARRPLSEDTVARNVLAHGTGAINVDACRIGGPAYTQEEWNRKGSTGSHSNHIMQKSDGMREAYKEGKIPVPSGRWSANATFSHDERCSRVGTAKIRGITGTAAGRMAGKESGVYGEYAGSERAGDPTGYVDEDGNEAVEEWACVKGCPIRALDDQAGFLRRGKWNGQMGGATGEEQRAGGVYGSRRAKPIFLDGDSGYASRFFYCTKPSTRERNAGCGHLSREIDGKVVVGNHHPTVKPLALCRWMVRLVTPPGGVVLDPFAGSGTVGVAAVLEGFDFAGIDQDQSYCEVARARIGHAEQHREEFEK